MMNLKWALLLTFLFLPSLCFSKTHTIEMFNSRKGEGMIFFPSFLKVAPGDKVIFTPREKGHLPRSVFTPKGSVTWKSKKEGKFEVILDKEGIYLYECFNHALMGMAGVIQVGESKNLNEARTFLKSYQNKFILNKKRLSKNLEKAY